MFKLIDTKMITLMIILMLTLRTYGLTWDTPTSSSNQKSSTKINKYDDKMKFTSSIEQSWREQQGMTTNDNNDKLNDNKNHHHHHDKDIHINSLETKQFASNNIHANDNNDDITCNDNEEFEPLRVQCEVNGYIIPAIIDTGAQITVMSDSCAKRCRIYSNIDKRYAGKAFGVGSTDILGRIDGLNMRVGPVSFQSRISILNNAGVDFLIGLDFLKRFRCEINMKENTLILQVRDKRIRVPFGNSYRYTNNYDDEAKIISSDVEESTSSVSSYDNDKINKRTYSDIDYSDDETYDSPLSMEGV